MSRNKTDEPTPAKWPFRLPDSTIPARVAEIRRRVDELGARAQYGWGHTIDFGPFTKEGVLEDNYLSVAGRWEAWGWWPRSFQGLRVADIGCYTGALSMLMAHRGAAEVLAVDEIEEHTAQCRYLCELFRLGSVRPLTASVYQLPQRVEPGSLDLIVLSGVLYHLSDMLLGLLIAWQLLKVGGVLLLESNVVPDDEHSYANFGRFAMGMWWQPSTLCLRDMPEFMGLGNLDVRMYLPDRCLARAEKTSDQPIAFRRGLNYPFPDLRDASPRAPDLSSMAPK